MGKRRVKVIQNFQVISLLQMLYDSLTVRHVSVKKIFQVKSIMIVNVREVVKE